MLKFEISESKTKIKKISLCFKPLTQKELEGYLKQGQRYHVWAPSKPEQLKIALEL